MKKSFYDMLGVTPQATQAEIDAGCTAALAKLNAPDRRGTHASEVEARVLREGRRILSNPELRVKYDAKLAEHAAVIGAKLTYVTDERSGRLWVGVSVVVVLLVAVGLIGIFLYPMLELKVDEVRVEQAQALARYHAKKNKEGITVKPTVIVEENGVVKVIEPPATEYKSR
jgi:hypothetical protein